MTTYDKLYVSDETFRGILMFETMKFYEMLVTGQIDNSSYFKILNLFFCFFETNTYQEADNISENLNESCLNIHIRVIRSISISTMS